jgi:hypothetical protein
LLYLEKNLQSQQLPELNYYLFTCLISKRRSNRNTVSVPCIHTIVFEVLFRRLTEWDKKLRLCSSLYCWCAWFRLVRFARFNLFWKVPESLTERQLFPVSFPIHFNYILMPLYSRLYMLIDQHIRVIRVQSQLSDLPFMPLLLGITCPVTTLSGNQPRCFIWLCTGHVTYLVGVVTVPIRESNRYEQLAEAILLYKVLKQNDTHLKVCFQEW